MLLARGHGMAGMAAMTWYTGEGQNKTGPCSGPLCKQVPPAQARGRSMLPSYGMHAGAQPTNNQRTTRPLTGFERRTPLHSHHRTPPPCTADAAWAARPPYLSLQRIWGSIQGCIGQGLAISPQAGICDVTVLVTVLVGWFAFKILTKRFWRSYTVSDHNTAGIAETALPLNLPPPESAVFNALFRLSF